MKFLVVGGGGREHALCWALASSPLVERLYCAPGNAGTAEDAENVPIQAEDVDALVAFATREGMDLVVVGPEAPLALGLADALRAAGVRVFGPTRAAAELEASKGFMKDLCQQAGVPTAAYARFTAADPALDHLAGHFTAHPDRPIVVKADGLAAGKGVTIAATEAEARAAVEEAFAGRFGDAGAQIVIEAFLEGEEFSFFALCDGQTALPFGWAQDHKRAFDGDLGPNTGGMGAYSPPPRADSALEAEAMSTIVTPTLNAMAAAGRPFVGVLFAGLMKTADGLKLLEFNVRFGDPEAQALMPRLRSDLAPILLAAADGALNAISVRWSARACLGVVLAAKGYPGGYQKGSVINGVTAAAAPGTTVFHAGTARDDAGRLTAQGGRVLCVSALGDDLAAAQKAAYAAVDAIDWPESFHRRDIGWRALG